MGEAEATSGKAVSTGLLDAAVRGTPPKEAIRTGRPEAAAGERPMTAGFEERAFRGVGARSGAEKTCALMSVFPVFAIIFAVILAAVVATGVAEDGASASLTAASDGASDSLAAEGAAEGRRITPDVEAGPFGGGVSSAWQPGVRTKNSNKESNRGLFDRMLMIGYSAGDEA
jgi:hypothetical protein